MCLDLALHADIVLAAVRGMCALQALVSYSLVLIPSFSMLHVEKWEGLGDRIM